MYSRKVFNYDDDVVRNEVIKFYKKNFKIILEQTNPTHKLIDLTGMTESHFGVEVERGGWTGNFWDNENYSMISGVGFPTINIPRRKEKYWQKKYMFYNKEYINESYKRNQFVRSNRDFSQFIIVPPEVICDNKKKIITRFVPKNSNEVEEFMSFRRKDVKTYNLIRGNFYLDTHF